MRIWYQSFVDPEAHAPYFRRLQAYLAEIADPGTHFEVAGIRPPDTSLHRLTELRCAVQAVENAFVAAERGFDAFCLGHFQDSGLYEARSAVDLPVVGMGEATLLHACQLGRTVGLVTIDPVFVALHWEQVGRYGLRERVVGVEAMATPVEDLVAAFESDEAYGAVRETFAGHARRLVAAGAEVVVSAGGLFGLLSARERSFSVDGAAVPNPIATAAKTAELAVKLRGLTGITAARVSALALPEDEAAAEFRAYARGELRDE